MPEEDEPLYQARVLTQRQQLQLLHTAITNALTLAHAAAAQGPSGELLLVTTKLQEAQLWLTRVEGAPAGSHSGLTALLAERDAEIARLKDVIKRMDDQESGVSKRMRGAGNY